MQNGGTFVDKNIKITCVGARIALSDDMHKIFTVFQGTAPGKVNLFWNPKTGTTQFCNVSAHRNWDKPRKNGTVGRYAICCLYKHTPETSLQQSLQVGVLLTCVMAVS